MLETRRSYVGGIQRFSTEDGPGIRTTVFFKGCPLRCAWCHNPELIDYSFRLIYNKDKCIRCGECIKSCPQHALSFENGEVTVNYDLCSQCRICLRECCTEALYTKSLEYTSDELVEEVLRDEDFYRKDAGGGATLSGGEVITHLPLALDTAKKCKQKGISVAVDTCGYGSYENLLALARTGDYILYDLKHMDREEHIRFTQKDPTLIWENLKKLCADDEIRKKIIIRVPFIHPVNDSKENLKALRDFMVEWKLPEVNFLPYHSMGMSKARQIHIEQQKYEEPSEETLRFARSYFEEKGIRVVLMGKDY